MKKLSNKVIKEIKNILSGDKYDYDNQDTEEEARILLAKELGSVELVSIYTEIMNTCMSFEDRVNRLAEADDLLSQIAPEYSYLLK